MTLCHRCGEAVEEGAEFCARCGAPQLYLMVEEETESGAEAVVAPTPRPGIVDWPVALSCAAVVAVAGLGIFLAGTWVTVLSVLGLVLVLSAGQLTVDLYRRRRPMARLDGKVGARVGAAAGVMLGAAKTVAMALGLWVERYVLHHGAQMDAQYADVTSSVAVSTQETMQKMTGQGLSAEQVRMIHSQGYHAMMVLLGAAMMWVVILLAATGGGALSGFLRRQRRMRA